MEISQISGLIFQISKILQNIFILLIIIKSYNSITSEIKLVSYQNFSSNLFFYNNKLRKLPEEYIYGSSHKLNYYYANIYFGENMQKQGLILDTGSSITTATCSQLCEKCGKHIRKPYDIKSYNKVISCSDEKCNLVSSKCKNSEPHHNCTFSISYSEGSSLKGTYINEIIRFGENYKEQQGIYIPIGCTISETHLFYKQEVNGIMGLANNNYNFVEILYKLGAIKRNVFSICYSQLGGIFTIGEINDKIHNENITYLPMITDRQKYFGLDIKSIYVNDIKVQNFIPGVNNIFIDSGTTISYFPSSICDEIINIMALECKKFDKSDACGRYEFHNEYGFCYYFNTTDELDYAIKNFWPTIHFKLENYDYKWTPERYLFNDTSNLKKPRGCMGFNKAYIKKITLGASWIIGHDIIFDRENKLLGIAEADCHHNINLNISNGLELDIEYNKYINNININKIKNILSLGILIFAIFLIMLMVVLIFWIIFRKNNQIELIKERKLKIKEYNTDHDIDEINKKHNDSSYIKVLEENSKGSKIKISLN